MKLLHVLMLILDLTACTAGVVMSYFFYRHGSDLAEIAAVVVLYLTVRTAYGSVKSLS